MEDSLSVSNDTLAIPSAADLGISIQVGTVPALTVGDTFNFPITISWNVKGSALLVTPLSSANGKSITQISVSQESNRIVENNTEKASVVFNYRLAVEDTGNLFIPALRFEIPTPMGQGIPLTTEPQPITVGAPFNIIPLLSGLCVGAIVILTSLLRMRRKKNREQKARREKEFQQELYEQMQILKQRITVANSRDWMHELERIAKKFALEKYQNENLEQLVKENIIEGWEGLVSAFAQARYGGGVHDEFELREIWKLAIALMNITEIE